MTKEIGTLNELNVFPGDVLKCIHAAGGVVEGVEYTITEDYTIEEYTINGHPISEVNCSEFQVVSRASAGLPKLWKNMTPEEKGALLLARHEGKVIEGFWDGCWEECDEVHKFAFARFVAYRVKPEPVVETVALYNDPNGGWSFYEDSGTYKISHRITFDLIDGKPDCNSIKMEEI